MILGPPEGYGTQMAVMRRCRAGSCSGLAWPALAACPSWWCWMSPIPPDAEGDTAWSQAILALRDAGSVVIVMAHRPSAISAEQGDDPARRGDCPPATAPILLPAATRTAASAPEIAAPRQKAYGPERHGPCHRPGSQDVIVFSAADL